MTEAYICDAVRTPAGRYGGALSPIPTDDLAAHPIKVLMARNPKADGAALDDVVLGCANQAGEDNRSVARMAALLAGLGDSAPGGTVTASPRAPACRARRWWACRRASWALARRRRPRSCWHALAFQFRPWM
jgi:hypothetical protein